MSLKLDSVLAKAKAKGYESKDQAPPPPEKITKPWQKDVSHARGVTAIDSSTVLSVDPSIIKNWEFHDRPESELGDIKALADDFLSIGQQQPCIVRPVTNDSNFQYELIIGERRWRAASLARINLSVIVKADLSDSDAALSQAAENENRIGISDFAKGMSFSKLIDGGLIKQNHLIEKLGRSKQYVSSLLSFSKIPSEIIGSIHDWSKVSAKTAEKIKQLANKGDDYIKAIISLSSSIMSKKIGHSSLEKKVSEIINANVQSKIENLKVYTQDGRHIFTWRQDNNNLPSMHFPKGINNLFLESKIDLDTFTENVRVLIEEQLKELSAKNTQ